jgi:uncharacterized protein
MRAPLRSTSTLSRLTARTTAIAAALLFAAAALSCASPPPASRIDVVAPPVGIGTPLPLGTRLPLSNDAAEAALPPGSDTSAQPAQTMESAIPVQPEAVPDNSDEAPPPVTGRLIALVLPLEVPAYERAASAVRDGFLDAAEAAHARSDCIVIAHGADGVISAFETARTKNVRVVVGPLVRDDLKTLAISGARLPWTLALNQLDDGTRLPSAVFSFPLSVESDGRMLARRALSSGVRRVDVIEGDSPLMRRFSTAFATAWTSEGGRAPDAFRFDATPDVLTQLRRTLTQNASDAVLLAVNGDRAALVKPFIGGVRAYASGLVFERPSQAVARDLDGVRVVEIPWLLTPDAPQFKGLPRRDFDSTALARLYALGLDAYRVAAAFENGPPPRFELEGATGHVSLVPGRQFLREGSMAVYRDGQLVPEPAP